MDCSKVLKIAGCMNTVALVRDALRYQCLRNGLTTIESVRVLQEFGDAYLDAEIDRLMSQQTYLKAEEVA